MEWSVSPMSHRTGMSRGVLLLALICAVSFGAIVRVALAGDNNHVSCVEHGFYSGDNNNDSSFFARVYQGCSATHRFCGLYTAGGSLIGSSDNYNSTGTCNTWSRDFTSSANECSAVAYLSDDNVFSMHPHSSTGC
jgi:hypothetical protein